jgi:hypothetical protein
MPARDEHPDLDPVLADAVRRTYVRPVDEGTASRHVSAIVAAAAGCAAPTRQLRRPRRAWRPVLGAGAVATLLLPVGLAAAGVALPAAVEKPYSVVGITLPHQSAEAPAPPVTTPRPLTAPTRAPASTTAKPRNGSDTGGRRSSTAPGTHGKPGTTGKSSSPRRPAAPPASSAANGKGTSNSTANSGANATGKAHANATPANGAANANGNGNASGTKAKPAARRPVATPKRPAASKPLTPAKPPAPPNLGPQQHPVAPPPGNAQPKKDPRG